MDDLANICTQTFMQRALIGALLVGLAAPTVGIFLVQRRLSLIGDGLGHVALAGVAAGVLFGQQPILTAWVAAVLAGALVEYMRTRQGTGGDVALAVLFYGGIAAGVVLFQMAPQGNASMLQSYLFGSILTTTESDLIVFLGLACVVIGTMWVLRPRLFAVALDEEYSRAVGMPVLTYNLLLSALTASTVVLSMRIVGLLLISALMIVPTATAYVMARSFASTVRWAMLWGVLCAVGGVVFSYPLNSPPGATIVLVTIMVYLVVVTSATLWAVVATRRRRAVGGVASGQAVAHGDHTHGPGCSHPSRQHGDHVDYYHQGEWHAAHQGHYHVHPNESDAEPKGVQTPARPPTHRGREDA